MRPTVSLVIPVRDDAEALEECLDRLREQTWAPDEVVVVDNGSTDDSARVAARFGARVVAELAPGIPHAAAAGYDAARCDVIVRCDADTVPGRRWVEQMVRRLDANPRLDAVSGIGWFHDAPRGLRRVTAVAYLGGYYLACHLALGHTALWGSNMAFRRSAWTRASGRVHRVEDVHDDLDLAFVLGPASRIRLVPVGVGVSVRSVVGVRQWRRRVRRARTTLEVNWATSPPWRRWQRRYQPIVSQIKSWVTRNPLR